MTAIEAPRSVAGQGWSAYVYETHTDLHVDPFIDALPDAVGQLISASQRRFWTVEHVDTDTLGWDVYVLLRDYLTG
jgi:hypothetical protein